MALVASLWWLWLSGFLLCAVFGVYQWIMSFLKTGGTLIKAANLTLEGVEVAFDENRTVGERASHARTRVVQEVAKEGLDRFQGFVIGFAAIFLSSMFGLMLILSIIFQFLK